MQDVKLDNILLSRRRPTEGGGRGYHLEPKLADFGLHVVRGFWGVHAHVVATLHGERTAKSTDLLS